MNSKTQVQFANEGAEKKQREEEVAARKRKVEDKEKWEGESYYHLHLNLHSLLSPQSEILRVSRTDYRTDFCKRHRAHPLCPAAPPQPSISLPIHTEMKQTLTLGFPFRPPLPYHTYMLNLLITRFFT